MNNENNKYVSREKYNNLKQTTNQWIDKCDKLVEQFSIVQDMEQDIDKLEEKCRILKEENINLLSQKTDIPDGDLFDELENENKSFRKEIRLLKRDNKELVEKNINKISQLERDILLKDGKIQRLEEGKKDLKERYNELKEDYREQQRWNRGGRTDK
jgi:chromosome segregation ATPase